MLGWLINDTSNIRMVPSYWLYNSTCVPIGSVYIRLQGRFTSRDSHHELQDFPDPQKGNTTTRPLTRPNHNNKNSTSCNSDPPGCLSGQKHWMIIRKTIENIVTCVVIGDHWHSLGSTTKLHVQYCWFIRKTIENIVTCVVIGDHWHSLGSTTKLHVQYCWCRREIRWLHQLRFTY